MGQKIVVVVVVLTIVHRYVIARGHKTVSNTSGVDGYPTYILTSTVQNTYKKQETKNLE